MSNPFAVRPKATDPDQWEGRRCQKIKTDGTRCKAYSLGDTGLCNLHSMTPDQLKEFQRSGGRNNKRYIHIDTLPHAPQGLKRRVFCPDIVSLHPMKEAEKLDNPEDVRKFLAKTINDLKSGSIAPETAVQLSQLCGTLLAAMKTDATIKPVAGDVPLPEIKEIHRSEDERATSEAFPGSEFGTSTN